MMKSLLMIRHAKSSWNDPRLKDFDRPLNSRGTRNAPMMAKRLKAVGMVPDLIIASPARRAQDTARAMAEVWGLEQPDLSLEPSLYHASATEILSVIQQAPEFVSRLALFGHNPGFHDAVERLTGMRIEKFRTCAIADITFSTSWRDLDWGATQLHRLDDPRQVGPAL